MQHVCLEFLTYPVLPSCMDRMLTNLHTAGQEYASGRQGHGITADCAQAPTPVQHVAERLGPHTSQRGACRFEATCSARGTQSSYPPISALLPHQTEGTTVGDGLVGALHDGMLPGQPEQMGISGNSLATQVLSNIRGDHRSQAVPLTEADAGASLAAGDGTGVHDTWRPNAAEQHSRSTQLHQASSWDVPEPDVGTGVRGEHKGEPKLPGPLAPLLAAVMARSLQDHQRPEVVVSGDNLAPVNSCSEVSSPDGSPTSHLPLAHDTEAMQQSVADLPEIAAPAERGPAASQARSSVPASGAVELEGTRQSGMGWPDSLVPSVQPVEVMSRPEGSRTSAEEASDKVFPPVQALEAMPRLEDLQTPGMDEPDPAIPPIQTDAAATSHASSSAVDLTEPGPYQPCQREAISVAVGPAMTCLDQDAMLDKAPGTVETDALRPESSGGAPGSPAGSPSHSCAEQTHGTPPIYSPRSTGVLSGAAPKPALASADQALSTAQLDAWGMDARLSGCAPDPPLASAALGTADQAPGRAQRRRAGLSGSRAFRQGLQRLQEDIAAAHGSSTADAPVLGVPQSQVPRHLRSAPEQVPGGVQSPMDLAASIADAIAQALERRQGRSYRQAAPSRGNPGPIDPISWPQISAVPDSPDSSFVPDIHEEAMGAVATLVQPAGMKEMITNMDELASGASAAGLDSISAAMQEVAHWSSAGEASAQQQGMPTDSHAEGPRDASGAGRARHALPVLDLTCLSQLPRQLPHGEAAAEVVRPTSGNASLASWNHPRTRNATALSTCSQSSASASVDLPTDPTLDPAMVPEFSPAVTSSGHSSNSSSAILGTRRLDHRHELPGAAVLSSLPSLPQDEPLTGLADVAAGMDLPSEAHTSAQPDALSSSSMASSAAAKNQRDVWPAADVAAEDPLLANQASTLGDQLDLPPASNAPSGQPEASTNNAAGLQAPVPEGCSIPKAPATSMPSASQQLDALLLAHSQALEPSLRGSLDSPKVCAEEPAGPPAMEAGNLDSGAAAGVFAGSSSSEPSTQHVEDVPAAGASETAASGAQHLPARALSGSKQGPDAADNSGEFLPDASPAMQAGGGSFWNDHGAQTIPAAPATARLDGPTDEDGAHPAPEPSQIEQRGGGSFWDGHGTQHVAAASVAAGLDIDRPAGETTEGLVSGRVLEPSQVQHTGGAFWDHRGAQLLEEEEMPRRGCPTPPYPAHSVPTSHGTAQSSTTHGTVSNDGSSSSSNARASSPVSSSQAAMNAAAKEGPVPNAGSGLQQPAAEGCSGMQAAADAVSAAWQRRPRESGYHHLGHADRECDEQGLSAKAPSTGARDEIPANEQIQPLLSNAQPGMMGLSTVPAHEASHSAKRDGTAEASAPSVHISSGASSPSKGQERAEPPAEDSVDAGNSNAAGEFLAGNSDSSSAASSQVSRPFVILKGIEELDSDAGSDVDHAGPSDSSSGTRPSCPSSGQITPSGQQADPEVLRADGVNAAGMQAQSRVSGPGAQPPPSGNEMERRQSALIQRQAAETAAMDDQSVAPANVGIQASVPDPQRESLQPSLQTSPRGTSQADYADHMARYGGRTPPQAEAGDTLLEPECLLPRQRVSSAEEPIQGRWRASYDDGGAGRASADALEQLSGEAAALGSDQPALQTSKPVDPCTELPNPEGSRSAMSASEPALVVSGHSGIEDSQPPRVSPILQWALQEHAQETATPNDTHTAAPDPMDPVGMPIGQSGTPAGPASTPMDEAGTTMGPEGASRGPGQPGSETLKPTRVFPLLDWSHQQTAEEVGKRDAEAVAAPIAELLQGDTHNLINAILARTRALRQASLAARNATSRSLGSFPAKASGPESPWRQQHDHDSGLLSCICLLMIAQSGQDCR